MSFPLNQLGSNQTSYFLAVVFETNWFDYYGVAHTKLKEGSVSKYALHIEYFSM